MKKLTLYCSIAVLFMMSDMFLHQTTKTKVSTEELKLYELIMDYRTEKGLPRIPLSNSLTVVAQTHCKDLIENKPDLASGCNPHSWSDKGEWSSCCYTDDHEQAECMWNKPNELTTYPGYGFEIACGASSSNFTSFKITAEKALASWQGSYHHNQVIINGSIWKKMKWNAIGVGIQDGFAVVWFGQVSDPEGRPNK